MEWGPGHARAAAPRSPPRVGSRGPRDHRTALLSLILALAAARPRTALDGTNLAISGVIVTATIIEPDGKAGNSFTATTGASGRATFTGVVITGSPGGYTLNFTSTGWVEVAAPVSLAGP